METSKKFNSFSEVFTRLDSYSSLKELNLTPFENFELYSLDEIANQPGNFVFLEKLNISENLLTELVMKGFQSLKVVKAKGNMISECKLKLFQLQVLDLSFNMITSIIDLSKLPQIRKLNLEGNLIERVESESVLACKNTLKEFLIAKNKIEFSGTEFLSFVDSLKTLKLTNFSIQDNPFISKNSAIDSGYKIYTVTILSNLIIFNGNKVGINKDIVNLDQIKDSILKEDYIKNLYITDQTYQSNLKMLAGTKKIGIKKKYKQAKDILKTINDDFELFGTGGAKNKQSFFDLNSKIREFLDQVKPEDTQDEDFKEEIRCLLINCNSAIELNPGLTKTLFNVIAQVAIAAQGKMSSICFEFFFNLIESSAIHDKEILGALDQVVLKKIKKSNYSEFDFSLLKDLIDFYKNIENNVESIYSELFEVVRGKYIRADLHSVLEDSPEDNEDYEIFITFFNFLAEFMLTIEPNQNLVEEEEAKPEKKERSMLSRLNSVIPIQEEYMNLNLKFLKDDVMQKVVIIISRMDELFAEKSELLEATFNLIINLTKQIRNFIKIQVQDNSMRVEQELAAIVEIKTNTEDGYNIVSLMGSFLEEKVKDYTKDPKNFDSKLKPLNPHNLDQTKRLLETVFETYGHILNLLPEQTFKQIVNSTNLFDILIMQQNDPYVLTGACKFTECVINNESIKSDNMTFNKIIGRAKNFKEILSYLDHSTIKFKSLADAFGISQGNKKINLESLSDKKDLMRCLTSILNCFESLAKMIVMNYPISATARSTMFKLSEYNFYGILGGCLKISDDFLRLSTVGCMYYMGHNSMSDEVITKIVEIVNKYTSVTQGETEIILSVIYNILSRIALEWVKNTSSSSRQNPLNKSLYSSFNFLAANLDRNPDEDSEIEEKNYLMASLLCFILTYSCNYALTSVIDLEMLKNFSNILYFDSTNYIFDYVPCEIERSLLGNELSYLFDCTKQRIAVPPYNYTFFRILVKAADVLCNCADVSYSIDVKSELNDCVNQIQKDIKDRFVLRTQNEVKGFYDFTTDLTDEFFEIVEDKASKQKPVKLISLDKDEILEQRLNFLAYFPNLILFLLGRTSNTADSSLKQDINAKFDPVLVNSDIIYTLLASSGHKIEDRKRVAGSKDVELLLTNLLNSTSYSFMKKLMLILDCLDVTKVGSKPEKEKIRTEDFKNDLSTVQKYGLDPSAERIVSEESVHNLHLRSLIISSLLRCIYSMLLTDHDELLKHFCCSIYSDVKLKEIFLLVDITNVFSYNICQKISIIIEHLFHSRNVVFMRDIIKESTDKFHHFYLTSIFLEKLMYLYNLNYANCFFVDLDSIKCVVPSSDASKKMYLTYKSFSLEKCIFKDGKGKPENIKTFVDQYNIFDLIHLLNAISKVIASVNLNFSFKDISDDFIFRHISKKFFTDQYNDVYLKIFDFLDRFRDLALEMFSGFDCKSRANEIFQNILTYLEFLHSTKEKLTNIIAFLLMNGGQAAEKFNIKLYEKLSKRSLENRKLFMCNLFTKIRVNTFQRRFMNENVDSMVIFCENANLFELNSRTFTDCFVVLTDDRLCFFSVEDKPIKEALISSIDVEHIAKVIMMDYDCRLTLTFKKQSSSSSLSLLFKTVSKCYKFLENCKRFNRNVKICSYSSINQYLSEREELEDYVIMKRKMKENEELRKQDQSKMRNESSEKFSEIKEMNEMRMKIMNYQLRYTTEIKQSLQASVDLKVNTHNFYVEIEPTEEQKIISIHSNRYVLTLTEFYLYLFKEDLNGFVADFSMTMNDFEGDAKTCYSVVERFRREDISMEDCSFLDNVFTLVCVEASKKTKVFFSSEYETLLFRLALINVNMHGELIQQ